MAANILTKLDCHKKTANITKENNSAMSNALDINRILEPNRPPFLFIYWNPFDQNSNAGGSWFDYVKDTSLAKYTADSVGQYIAQSSAEQVTAIECTGRRICGALYDLKEQLDQIAGALQGVNQRINLVLDEAKTSNLLLENIAELLRIPDSQKQRQHHIEMALKFLKNSLRDEDLYQDALRELLEAEKFMPSDYFILHRIGMIYLYVPTLGNLEKAVEYFSKAGKYAAVECHPEAARLSNILNKKAGKQFSEQPEPSAADISVHAADSYFQAATALYALGRFAEAAKMTEKAVNCQPEEAKYFFFLSKYLVRSGNPNSAITRLQKAIELSPEMTIATLGDFDLNGIKIIIDLLDALDTALNQEFSQKIQHVGITAKSISPNSVRASQWISNIENEFKHSAFPQKKRIISQLPSDDASIIRVLELEEERRNNVWQKWEAEQKTAVEAEVNLEEVENNETAKSLQEWAIRREQDKITDIIREATTLESNEKTKWFRKKDFSRVRELYAQAAALGSKEASDALKRLPS